MNLQRLFKQPFLVILFFIFLGWSGAHANGPQTLKLPESTLTVSQSPYWVERWNLDQPQGVGLKNVLNFDSAINVTFSGSDFTSVNTAQATALTQDAEGTWVWTFADSNIEMVRKIKVQGKVARVALNVKFKQKAPERAFVNLVGQAHKGASEERDDEFLYYTQSKIERHTLTSSMDPQEVTTEMKWLGFASRYFLMAVFPQTPAQKTLMQTTGDAMIQASLEYPVKDGVFAAEFDLVFLPKQIDLLRSVDKTLDTSVNLGFFSFIAYPILLLLKFIQKFVGNFGLAIIILTIIVKIALLPLVIKGVKGMRKMAEFQPKLKALQDRYKDDKVALNREMMVLMKQSGYNPMAGCFPLLLQMPIFFALYTVLYTTFELYRAPFMGWIVDLSARDPYYITPVLLTAVMFLQQKLTPPSPGMDPAQQKVLQWMPVIFGAFMVTTPAGLCIYMLVNTVFSMGQQWFINKKLGIPNAGVIAGM